MPLVIMGYRTVHRILDLAKRAIADLPIENQNDALDTINNIELHSGYANCIDDVVLVVRKDASSVFPKAKLHRFINALKRAGASFELAERIGCLRCKNDSEFARVLTHWPTRKQDDSCFNCAFQNPESYLKSIEGQAVINLLRIDLTSCGYRKFNHNVYVTSKDNLDFLLDLTKELQNQGLRRFFFQEIERTYSSISYGVFVHQDELMAFL
jgi:hypothetical protein